MIYNYFYGKTSNLPYYLINYNPLELDGSLSVV